MDTEKKVWFITGSNSGFGRSLTEAVLAKGDKVVATTRHPEEIADLVKQYSETVKAVHLDITKSNEISAAIDTALSTFGHVDVLVNNAGFGTMGAVEEVSEDKIRYQFEVNCFGTLNLTRAMLPHFRQRKSGHILNVSSVGGFTSFPGAGIYSATKFAIEGYSEALAKEIAPLGIKLTLVEPGAFRTDFAGDSLATPGNLIADYESTAHKFFKQQEQMNGQQPGDPDKAAQAMIKAVESDNPPLHLVLGEDALQGVRKKIESYQKELEAWEDVTLSTSFEDSKTGSLS
ncbi:MAG TPA: oxidoreductase [Xenococcaceae cyanobacterium]|jgi:NAD(P)-dependent dehydrogenase (short-subunit alcohol dehydrogenase family)